MIPPEHPKDLFKRQGAEKGRTVEHGAFQPDRTPRKEVGSLEFVTTLVEIPFHCFSVQRTDGMLEESGNGNNHGQFPAALAQTFLERFAAQRAPTFHHAQHLLTRRRTALIDCTMAAFAGVVGLKTNVQRDITNPENIILFNFVKLFLIIFFSFVL